MARLEITVKQNKAQLGKSCVRFKCDFVGSVCFMQQNGRRGNLKRPVRRAPD